jgi:hypothetical protein
MYHWCMSRGVCWRCFSPRRARLEKGSNLAAGIVTEAGESRESALLPQTASTGPNPHVKFPGPIIIFLPVPPSLRG